MRAGLTDLSAFVAVATHRSFSRAAAALGLSPSALSHTVRGLEERLDLRLLNRTTRRIAPRSRSTPRPCDRIGRTIDGSDGPGSA